MEELQQLQSEDVSERAAAAQTLAEMGPGASAAAVALVQACRGDDDVSQWAVAALEELGPPDVDQIEPLRTLISSSDPLVAYWAITLLGRAGSAAIGCQDDLAVALKQSSDNSVRERSAWALGKIGATSPTALQALTEAANTDQSPRLARIASQSLSQIEH